MMTISTIITPGIAGYPLEVSVNNNTSNKNNKERKPTTDDNKQTLSSYHRHHPRRRYPTSTSTSTTTKMTAWLLCIIGVIYFTDAIRPSNIPTNGANSKININSNINSNKLAASASARRPLRRLFYRRLDDAGGSSSDVDIDVDNNEVVARRSPAAISSFAALHKFRKVDDNINSNSSASDDANTKRLSRNALIKNLLSRKNSKITNNDEESMANELSTILENIEALAQEVEGSNSFPPSALKRDTKSRSSSDTTTSVSASDGIKTVYDLRKEVLDEGKELKDVLVSEDVRLLVNATTEQLLNHDVVKLMVQRFKTGSTPGNRAPDDMASLALSIEGGGMRGAVSAGMASAIACLGLCDTFDTVYGSSAGSVIGSYMISRQMCMDVYVDILPAAKRSFVCTKRIVSVLAVTAVDMFLSGVLSRRQRRRQKRRSRKLNRDSSSNGDAVESLTAEEEFEALKDDMPSRQSFAARVTPGMNISFVLDGIMDAEHGIRPLDMDAFRRNDQKQPLRVASSYAKDGKLYSKCFGREHFFHDEQPATREDGARQGLFACLEPSMTVPGATGPPVRMATHDSDEVLPYFDAFCFEPVPYRSAVQEGATHVLALCSRPEGFEPKTKPGVYEQAIAPLYFKSHGLPEVAEFFSRGGQQYIYLEDYMTLEEGKVAGMNNAGPISVPPNKMLYGVEKDHENQELSAQRDEKWNKAHLLPLKVPIGTAELPVLEQNRDAVRQAVREGFAAAFDLLAPAIGLNTHHELTGTEIAALIFPANPGMLDEIILQEQMRVSGDDITRLDQPHQASIGTDNSGDQTPSDKRRQNRVRRDRFLRSARHSLRVLARNKRRKKAGNRSLNEITKEFVPPSAPELSFAGGSSQLAASFTDDQQKAEHLLNLLPGIQSGKLAILVQNLYHLAAGSDSSLPPPSSSDNEDTLKP